MHFFGKDLWRSSIPNPAQSKVNFKGSNKFLSVMSTYVLLQRNPKDETACSEKMFYCMMTLVVRFPFQSK